MKTMFSVHQGPPRLPSNRPRDLYGVLMRDLFPSFGKVDHILSLNALRLIRMLTLHVLARMQLQSSSRVKRLMSTRFRMTYPHSKKYQSRLCSRFGKALRQGRFGASCYMRRYTLAIDCKARCCVRIRSVPLVTKSTMCLFNLTQHRDTQSTSRVGSSSPWSCMVSYPISRPGNQRP